MKIIITTASLLMLTSIEVNAKTHTSVIYFQQENKVDEKVKRMDELVKLNEEQKKKYKALIEKSEKEKKELQEKAKTATPEESKKIKAEFKSNYEKELAKVLTAEQMKILKEKTP